MEQTEEEDRRIRTEDAGGSFKPAMTKPQIAGILHRLAMTCLTYELECVVAISLH